MVMQDKTESGSSPATGQDSVGSNLTSNPLGEWLVHAKNLVEHSDWSRCRDALDKAVFEIERLTAELAQWRSSQFQQTERAEKAIAECSRLRAALEELRSYIKEVWRGHRDKDAQEYNECEEDECMWCSETTRILNEALAGAADFDPLASKDHDLARAASETDEQRCSHGTPRGSYCVECRGVITVPFETEAAEEKP